MRFLKRVGIFSFGQLMAAVLSFVYTLLAARMLGVEKYGLFQACLGLYGLTTVFSLPLNLAALHCVGQSHEAQRSRMLGEFVWIACAVSGIITLCLFLFAPWIRMKFDASSNATVISVASLVLPTAILTTYFGYLQARHKYWFFAWVRSLQFALGLGVGYLLMRESPSVFHAIMGYVAGMSAVTVYLLIKFPPDLRVKRFDHVRKELSAVAWILGVLGTTLMIENLPMVVGRVRLDSVESGHYGALFNLRNTFRPFAMAVIFPLYSHLLENKHDTKLMKKAMGLMALQGGAFVLAGILMPEFIFRTLYGEAFVRASDYMASYGGVMMLLMIAMTHMFYQIAMRTLNLIELAVPVVVLVAGIIFFGNTINGILWVQLCSSISYFVAAPMLQAAGYPAKS